MTTYQSQDTPVVFDYPSAVQLLPVFDADRLREDLNRLSDHRWKLQQNYTTTGPGRIAPFDWRALPLRSPTGSPERTDPGGAGLDDFADTHWLTEVPYMAEVLTSLRAPLRSARLLALAPEAKSKVHFEMKIGFPWANLRLHVPITTNPHATLTIDGITHQWRPGTLWFGDFCRWHQVANEGSEPRIHLIVDTTLTPELLDLFPASFREKLSPDDVLFARPALPLDEPEQYQGTFEIPLSFTDWEEPDGLFLEPQQRVAITTTYEEGRLWVTIDGERRFGLVHLGDGEFRLSGWTDERTLQIIPGGSDRIVLRTRQGSTTRELAL
ncbi:aspartyl/asparaginyl beta-hydroxylase domain-containing protein [Streptomyces sp. NPDC005209]|uniref:aspartyl/asparaginyl beta-hydroxylase domain-containing protein n=1 Tax=Streptomyces sp. NPDC005209 TaxID=3156715 RepID=UPI0033A74D93